jgi:hypothetical protein
VSVLHGWVPNAVTPIPVSDLCDPGLVRASEFKHSVQGGSGGGDFRGLGLIRTRTKGIADRAFVSTHCGLDLGPQIGPAVSERSRRMDSRSTFASPPDGARTISRMCRSRCVGAVAADGPGTAVARGGCAFR